MARSEDEGVSPSVLLGYLLYLENRSGGDQALSDIGWKIFKGGSWKANPSASLEEAIWMVERSGMSQAVYLDVRLRFKDRFSFPPLMQIRAENHRHRPALTVKRHGVRAPLMQCLSLTLTERLQHMYLSGLDNGRLQVSFKAVWGLDGIRGDHPDYNQLTKVSYNTKQVMSVCFGLKEVAITDGSGILVTRTISVAGANKPQNTRPLALFPAKETPELLADFVPKVEFEVQEVKTRGVKVEIREGEELIAECSKCSLSMVDGKMINTLLNLGGAYCTMCAKSQSECEDKDVIQAGFVIERDLETMKDIANALTEPDTGVITRKRAIIPLDRKFVVLP